MRRAILAFLVGVSAAVVSIGRVWLGNAEAPTQVLWAEDGLFPLCVLKAGLDACTFDPFAGYLLFVPRLFAALVAATPAAQWALAANVLAAMFAGVMALTAYALARRAGLSLGTSVFIGLLPTVLPITGLEAINALGSSYMPLLYVATLAVALVPSDRPLRRLAVASVGVLLVLTALTIPLAIALIGALAVQVIRKSLPKSTAITWLVALIIGSAMQMLIAVTAERPRQLSASGETLSSFLETLGRSLPLLVGIPAQTQPDGGFALPQVPSWFGIVASLALLVAGVVLSLRRGVSQRAAGLMILLGLIFAFAPSFIGGASNRYFVTPMALWVASILVLSDEPLRAWMVTRGRRVAVVAAGVLIALAWGTQLPASHLRSTPQPSWSAEVSRVVSFCTPDPALQDAVVFTPAWPPPTLSLDSPTDSAFPCALAWRWQ